MLLLLSVVLLLLCMHYSRENPWERRTQKHVRRTTTAPVDTVHALLREKPSRDLRYAAGNLSTTSTEALSRKRYPFDRTSVPYVGCLRGANAERSRQIGCARSASSVQSPCPTRNRSTRSVVLVRTRGAMRVHLMQCVLLWRARGLVSTWYGTLRYLRTCSSSDLAD